MIEVFKTNITDEEVADSIVQLLTWHFPDARINFDLEDCDRILRVEMSVGLLRLDDVAAMVEASGYACEVLED